MCNDFSEFETIGLERIDLVVVVVVVVERAGGWNACPPAIYWIDETRRDEAKNSSVF